MDTDRLRGLDGRSTPPTPSPTSTSPVDDELATGVDRHLNRTQSSGAGGRTTAPVLGSNSDP